MGWGCAAPGCAQGEQLNLHPGSRGAGCSMAFSFPIQTLGWRGDYIQSFTSGLVEVWVLCVPDPAGLWCGGKCPDCAEPWVMNTELGGQALPQQALRVRLELSQKAAQGGG